MQVDPATNAEMLRHAARIEEQAEIQQAADRYQHNRHQIAEMRRVVARIRQDYGEGVRHG
jgi:hypothetical protein